MPHFKPAKAIAARNVATSDARTTATTDLNALEAMNQDKRGAFIND
jgi:hypothetical protein